MEDMLVMIVGSGAREHALSAAYENSQDVRGLIVVPGNSFMPFRRQKEVLVDSNCSLKDPKSILALARKYHPDLVDVAQDDAIAAGVTDVLREEGFRVFGPSRLAAQIEWDKCWSRKFVSSIGEGIKKLQPYFESFSDWSKADACIRQWYSINPHLAVYIKAAGLCQGKGALKATDRETALNSIRHMADFGPAGASFLVEQNVEGEEFSAYAVSDGKCFRMLKSAQDNKKLLDDDQGPQTGGMGAVSPAGITDGIEGTIQEEIFRPVIESLRGEGREYKGVLYLGGVRRKDGVVFILEFNARWGDPEAQVIIPGIKTDYSVLANAVIDSKLRDVHLEEDKLCRVCVVGASRGYPDNYDAVKGKRIHGLERAMKTPGVQVYGAGIKVEDGKLYANGGRLFSIVAQGHDILTARQRAYAAMSHVYIEDNGLHFRTDIGWRDVQRAIDERNR